jgi:hypothetical protein
MCSLYFLISSTALSVRTSNDVHNGFRQCPRSRKFAANAEIALSREHAYGFCRVVYRLLFSALLGNLRGRIIFTLYVLLLEYESPPFVEHIWASQSSLNLKLEQLHWSKSALALVRELISPSEWNLD